MAVMLWPCSLMSVITNESCAKNGSELFVDLARDSAKIICLNNLQELH